ncbi:hypothetical protein KKA14_20790 [bacterium]|nr:hypothetical protein [bacterium]
MKKATLSYKAGQVIPKNLESFAVMTQHFTVVEPDIIGFRGEHEGASHKDFGFNIRAFRQDEKLTINAFSVFQRLFETLEKNKKVRVITFENQRKIREYSVAYSFSNYMICLGTSHLKTSKSIMINDKDLFPYMLLFVESKVKKFGRVLSREVADGGKVKIYNDVAFSEKSAFLYYEALYLILHLLPEKAWKAKDTQMCVDFLVRELNEIKRKKKKLLYCVNLPSLST